VRRRLLACALAALAVIAAAGAARAHPLGNFTVNRAAALTLTPGRVAVTYTVDLAEIPTVQAMPAIDADGDGLAAADELGAWAGAEAATILPSLVLEVDGARVELALETSDAALEAGQAGLEVLRLQVVAAAPLPRRGALAFTDTLEDGRIGWREVTAAGVDGVALEGSDVPATSPSEGLRRYPQGAAESPLDVRAMRASFAPGSTVADASPGAVPSLPGLVGGDRLVGLLGERGWPFLLLGLLLAVAFGAWHALMPGHGKTLMAASMIGSRGGIRQAAAAAAAVAGMHSASVLALGLAVLALEATFRPETLYPWLTVVSGVTAIAVGASLVRRRWRAWRHARSHATDDGHVHMHDHEHGLPIDADGRLGLRGVGALALAGGIVPAPSALLVLLAAIQLHRTAAGVAMVGAFSIGLAVALLAIGAGAVTAREAFARRASSAWAAGLPLAAAAVMVVAGAAIVAGAAARL